MSRLSDLLVAIGAALRDARGEAQARIFTEVRVELDRFDLGDPAFIADPYPLLGALREAAPIFWYERTGQWMVTRFALVQEVLRDRRMGRVYEHRYTHAELGKPEPDPRWQAFRDHERWSLLQLEPPDHTRIRSLLTKVFTPTAVAALRPSIEARAERLLGTCVERGRFELLADYAQPFSVGVICSMLGVPEADAPQLLDWSHAIVKMYELTATDAQKQAATQAAAEFMDYTRAVIADKRRRPDELPKPVKDNKVVEMASVVLPTILVLVVFTWGFKAYVKLFTAPPDSYEIQVRARQWSWEFEYPNGSRSFGELHVPVDRPVRLVMNSQDVLHSFFVPAFRVKMDVLPNRYTSVWFQATKPGEFDLFCTEYCGTAHSGISTRNLRRKGAR